MKHKLKGIAKTREVFLDGQKLDLEASLKFHNHSPDGFNWGYNGSGPAQLALAIMLQLTGTYVGYQKLKFEVISAIPQNHDFDIEFECDYDFTDIRKEAIRNARANNKMLTVQYLSKFPNYILINFVHPLQRHDIGKRMQLAGYVKD